MSALLPRTTMRGSAVISHAARNCRAFATARAEDFPVKAAKAARPHRHGIAFWAEADGHVLLVTRPPKGLLGGMRALPSGSWGDAPRLEEAPLAADWALIEAPVRHVFTHFSLDLSVAVARVTRANVDGGEWWPIDRLGEAGLPTVFDKAARLALEARMTKVHAC